MLNYAYLSVAPYLINSKICIHLLPMYSLRRRSESVGKKLKCTALSAKVVAVFQPTANSKIYNVVLTDPHSSFPTSKNRELPAIMSIEL